MQYNGTEYTHGVAYSDDPRYPFGLFMVRIDAEWFAQHAPRAMGSTELVVVELDA